MRKIGLLLLVAGLLHFSAPAVQADWVINTGEGSIPSGTFIHSNQYLAGYFSVDDPWYINSIEGYMYKVTSGDISAVLYKNDAGLTPLISWDFNLANIAPNWYGVSGLDYYLEPGSYWVGFESHSTAIGAMPPGPPHPLSNYALFQSGTWYTNYDNSWGFRIDGTPVPLPGAVWLMGAGLLGLAGWRRRKINK